jgi:N-acetyl-gamma-glutamyl-phosphate reductase
MTNKIRVGIIGGAGYTAGELTRLLIYHPNVELVFSLSESSANKPVSNIHQDLAFETDLKFTDSFDPNVDVVFICRGHGQSKLYLEKQVIPASIKVIDLSQDFRIADSSHSFVYGLPELNRDEIETARYVANPGCFATCIQLGLLPIFAAGLIKSDVHISGITGSTGAGQALSSTTHFSWRNNNMSIYKALQHQHLLEIGQTLHGYMPNYDGEVNFIPYRGNFTRGIITTSYFKTVLTDNELFTHYSKFYNNAAFTHVVRENPDMKMVVNTNKALVSPKVIDGKAVIVTVIDNLLKGASGQALQNMNLMFGLDESIGLRLKSIGY